MIPGRLPERHEAGAFRVETEQKDLAALATKISRCFRTPVAGYAHLGRTIQKVLLENRVAEPRPRRSAKIGRNEPCPYGSGRKHKICGRAGRR